MSLKPSSFWAQLYSMVTSSTHKEVQKVFQPGEYFTIHVYIHIISVNLINFKTMMIGLIFFNIVEGHQNILSHSSTWKNLSENFVKYELDL